MAPKVSSPEFLYWSVVSGCIGWIPYFEMWQTDV
jgi:hypothetical protein